jgi:L-threonine kinase
MTRMAVVTRRTGVDLRVAAASAHGTFGELLQGALPDGTDFLVTLPIDRRSYARFRLDVAGPLQVFPSHKWKAARLARMLLDAGLGDAGGLLILDSDLLVGKGLASSSADLVATVRALGHVLDLDTSPEAVETWLRAIEPTDGVMYPGVVVFEHRRVRMRDFLGTLPPLTIVAVDEGGQVDTMAFNRLEKSFSAQERNEYDELLGQLTQAISTGDLASVGAVTTRSAVLNQRLLPKRHLDQMIVISRTVGGLGVVCAHSGTMIGILLATADPEYAARLDAVRQACADFAPRLYVFQSLAFGQEGPAA